MSYYSESDHGSYADDPYRDNYDVDPYGDEYVPSYGIPAPVPERGHRMRNKVIAAVTAVAIGAGTSYAALRGGGTHETVKKPTAAGKLRPGLSPSTIAASNYDPAACVAESSGETTLDLACAEEGFSNGISSAVTKDLGAMVTVNISVPIEYTPAQKQQILQQLQQNGDNASGQLAQGYTSTTLSGERVDYNGTVETITAGHGNELFSQGQCAGNGISTVAAGGSASKQGFTVNLNSFQTGYVSTVNETAGDIDFATVTTTGTEESAYDSLPAIPTEIDAHPQIGELFEALTEEPTYGGSTDQEPNSPDPSQRQPRIIRLVYAGPDPSDPQNGVFISLGAAEGDQGSVIGGASGSAIVSEKDGVENAVLVRGQTEAGTDNKGSNEIPATITAAQFAAEYGTDITENGQPVNVQPVIGQFLPAQNSTSVTECR